MTLEQILEKLHDPNEHAVTFEPGELTKLLEELQAARELINGNRFLVSSTQKVKHGKWIWVKNYRDCEGDIYSQYKCSCCDFGVGGVYSIKDLTHFCGNCGADMRGDTNE